MQNNDTVEPNSAAEKWELTLRVHDGGGDIRCLAEEWVTRETALAIGQIVSDAIRAAESA